MGTSRCSAGTNATGEGRLRGRAEGSHGGRRRRRSPHLAGGAGWRCCMRTPCPEAERAGRDARPLLAPGGLTQDPPASLGAVGRAVWRTIVEAGSCQDSDALVLERYCQLHDRRAVLLALVGTEGYVVPGVKQPSTAHPGIPPGRG